MQLGMVDFFFVMCLLLLSDVLFLKAALVGAKWNSLGLLVVCFSVV